MISGDLGQITHVGSTTVDCLVSPTSHVLFNPGVGVAGVVHARAGTALNDHVATLADLTRRDRPTVVTTPGFATAMNKLVHCIGPLGFAHDRRVKLYETYRKVLAEMTSLRDITCAAVASISTGLLRYPVDEAAEVAMEAVRDYLRANKWQDKTIAFVCIDKSVLKAFEDARVKTRATFFCGGAA